MSESSWKGVLRAAESWDWEQVVRHQGEPCFHVEHDSKFCGRARRWEGHRGGGDHDFLSLADLLRYWKPE